MDLTDVEFDTAFDAAEVRGKALLETAPRAREAVYVADTGSVVINLVNGCTFVFPARRVQDLHGASNEALSVIEVQGRGLTLHWPCLDADIYVPALLAGVFGTRAWMAALEAEAGVVSAA